jgi:hypothetical protein
MSDNIVHFKGRPKATDKTLKRPTKSSNAPIIDMTERRQEIITEERRKGRRTVLTSFIGAFCVVPRKGLMKVTLHDVSEEGLSFDVDMKSGQFPVGEEIAMRVYVSQESYFTISAKIQNVRAEEEEVYRHGALFAKSSASDQAIHYFVKFIEHVSASLQHDTGDHMVSGAGNR